MRPHIFLLSSATLLVSAAFAQEQPTSSAPVAQPAAAAISPARGSTMESVKAKFGAPSQEIPAVGRPPITRWEYPGYVVYFENDRVLHTVVVK
jgi:hypothetical protein